jgi:GNAT superfamily N-acetyltransferase
MSVIIRPLHPFEDFPLLASLLSLVLPEPVTVEQLHLFERLSLPLWRRTIAVGDGPELIGYSSIIQPEPAAAGLFDLWLATHPDHRRQGIGGRLFAEATAFLEGVEGWTITSQVADDDAVSLQFAQRRGFTVAHHHRQSSLDVTAFEETPFLPSLEKAVATGIRFFNYLETGDTPEARRKLYELNRLVALDAPDSSSFPPFAAYSQERFENRQSSRQYEGVIIAADGHRWVGLAITIADDSHRLLYNEITGVTPEYRGRRIAQALKLLTIRYARQRGMLKLRTHNDAENGPILAINERMGYRPEPGYYSLTKRDPGQGAV